MQESNLLFNIKISDSDPRKRLTQRLFSIIADGLNRASLTRCSTWAEHCRVMGKPYPGPWSFEHHPWLREMHDSTAPKNIGRKAAQMGYTETLLNLTFFTIDIKRTSVLYALPTKTPDASDFSASRFDPALELSPYLQNLFNDVRNIGHKRAGSVNLFIRGSRSRAGLKSIPAGLLCFDEVDEMTQENIALAEERQSGQLEEDRIIWKISTPTVDGYGIDKAYALSSKESFFFRCPCCGRMTSLIFPDSLVVTADSLTDPRLKDSHLICRECKNRLDHQTKHQWLATGVWVPEYPDRVQDCRGFYINQLYSPTVTPAMIAELVIKAQTSPADDQELHNSKMGLPHLVEDARITDQQIDSCIKQYKNGTVSRAGHVTTIGIDVGKFLHYVVKQHNPADKNQGSGSKVLEIGKTLSFDSLDNLLMKHRPHMTVIDAHPEKRKAFEFANRFHGFVKLCYYGNSVNGKQINESNTEPTVTVDRTSWLDYAQSMFINNSIQLPVDTPDEYKRHIKALVRVPDKDSHGNPISKYINIDDDHYAHANSYAEIAYPLAVTNVAVQDIKIKM